MLVSFRPTPPDALQKFPKKGLPSIGSRLSPVLVGVGVFVGSPDVFVGVFVGVLVDVFVGVLVGVFFDPVGVLVGVFVGVLVGVLVGVGGIVGTVFTARAVFDKGYANAA